MKRILFLSFYFEPDLCAGAFRNSPLVHELAKQSTARDIQIDVFTTFPNRYSTYTQPASEIETIGNINIKRIQLPDHHSGFRDQIFSFTKYYRTVKKLTHSKKYDLVFASSSRLFTAYLGYSIALKTNSILYLDIRDIFVENMNEVLKSHLLKAFLIPLLNYIEKKTFNYAKHINLISEGFKEYFARYNKALYSYFTNGIDPIFIQNIPDKKKRQIDPNRRKMIVYAGNIGEGQGLHKIIPDAAKLLGEDYLFRIIGDGGAKKLLSEELAKNVVKNVQLLKPMSRKQLLEEYNNADYLFLHLNDYEAFKKVLPSKIFELGCFNKPLLAGVNGFAKQFIINNINDGSILFEPCNAQDLVSKIKSYQNYRKINRKKFIEKFNRENVNRNMAASILEYL